MTVPVRNLYYLLCYAWDSLPSLEAVDVGQISADRPEDLFAKVLIDGTRYALRRGLDRSYIAESDDLRGIRGKLDVSRSVKRNLFSQGKAACQFDEFSYDIPNNQILKATMIRLTRTRSVNRKLRDELHDLTRRLRVISDVPVSSESFRQIRIHRNNAHYSLMLRTCEILYRNLLWEQGAKGWKFNDFRGDERQMGLLFEAFIRNFLHREQDRFKVKRDNIKWDLDAVSDESQWLPIMQTDITLRDQNETIVVETKFNAKPLQESYGTKKVRSGHLYQIFAYLKNLESDGGPDAAATGVLLYPAVGRHLDFRYEIQGHEIWVKSLELDQGWQGIHEDLLGSIDEIAGVIS